MCRAGKVQHQNIIRIDSRHELANVHAHVIRCGQLSNCSFEMLDRRAPKPGHAVHPAEKEIEVARGYLNQPLQKLLLSAPFFGMMPKSLPRFVRLPPIPMVVEVASIQIGRAFAPSFRRHKWHIRLALARRAKTMPGRICHRVRIPPRDEPIRWKRKLRIARCTQLGKDFVLHHRFTPI